MYRMTADSAVYRVRAPNPSVMTGEGTNSYFIIEGDEAFLVDPGPDIIEHVEALLDALGHRMLKGILLTHMHPDHSPASNAIKAATGAAIYGIPPEPEDMVQDHSVTVDHRLRDGETLMLKTLTVEAVTTPGHTSNHLCFWLPSEHMMFTGDHIMQGSTVVIVPPFGDMQDYLSSLEKLKGYTLNSIAPGHGELITDPVDEINRLITHRLWRESKVVQGLENQDWITLNDLTRIVYADVHESLHELASRSLHAHLIKLCKEGRVSERGDCWRLSSKK
ncbi:MAG: MBL fold metallo-hydrolase [Cellvibrionales bacterium]|nr:MBL fold metallo-hydrolase [Cellvibrionales bacterium]